MFEAHHHAAKTWKRKPADSTEDEEADELGLRKVRMGTFEDSGKCKGSVSSLPLTSSRRREARRWAFVDFTSIQHATKALTDPHNHSLDGRDLKLEYASADAIRRGGGKLPPGSVTKTKGKKRPREEADETGETEGGALVQTALEVAESVEKPPREKKAKKEGKGDKKRQSSGATLANAPRAKTGIVAGASSGKKVVFE